MMSIKWKFRSKQFFPLPPALSKNLSYDNSVYAEWQYSDKAGAGWLWNARLGQQGHCMSLIHTWPHLTLLFHLLGIGEAVESYSVVLRGYFWPYAHGSCLEVLGRVYVVLGMELGLAHAR